MTMLDLIESKAFTSLWYWVLMAVLWARTVSAPLGVPLDQLDRARGFGPEGDRDAFGLIRVGVARQLAGTLRQRSVMVGIWAFGLSLAVGLAALGVELAQALALLAVPMAAVQAISTRTARRLAGMDPELDLLVGELRRLRIKVQAIGVAALFATAAWGMVHSMRALTL